MSESVPSKELVKPAEGPYSVRPAVRDGKRVLEIITERYGYIVATVEPDDPEMRATAEIMAQSWWKYQQEQRASNEPLRVLVDPVHRPITAVLDGGSLANERHLIERVRENPQALVPKDGGICSESTPSSRGRVAHDDVAAIDEARLIEQVVNVHDDIDRANGRDQPPSPALREVVQILEEGKELTSAFHLRGAIIHALMKLHDQHPDAWPTSTKPVSRLLVDPDRPGHEVSICTSCHKPDCECSTLGEEVR